MEKEEVKKVNDACSVITGGSITAGELEARVEAIYRRYAECYLYAEKVAPCDPNEVADDLMFLSNIIEITKSAVEADKPNAAEQVPHEVIDRNAEIDELIDKMRRTSEAMVKTYKGMKH